MKKLTVYNVYLDDGKSAFRVTVPAVGVPASRLALAVLHPGQFCRLPEGSDSPPNGIERQV